MMARDKTDKTGNTPATSATTATRDGGVNYQWAVDMAKSHFNNGRYWGGRDLLDDTDNYKSVQETVSLMLLNQFPHTLNTNDAAALVTLRYAFASKILAGEPIPEDYRELAASFVIGENSGPPQKSGSKSGRHRHAKIVSAVKMLCEYGMTATRNDASSNKDSACDAVAEALRELGLRPITFKGVKDIWGKRDA